jgi:predicted HTH transcriptional regulator
MSLRKEQHELFARFFEKPTRKALRELLKNNTGEYNHLDFKGEWPEYTKLAKHVLAFSNTGGGALIIGVKSKEKEDGTKDGTFEAVGITKIIDKSEIFKLMLYLKLSIFPLMILNILILKGKNFKLFWLNTSQNFYQFYLLRKAKI